MQDIRTLRYSDLEYAVVWDGGELVSPSESLNRKREGVAATLAKLPRGVYDEEVRKQEGGEDGRADRCTPFLPSLQFGEPPLEGEEEVGGAWDPDQFIELV